MDLNSLDFSGNPLERFVPKFFQLVAEYASRAPRRNFNDGSEPPSLHKDEVIYLSKLQECCSYIISYPDVMVYLAKPENIDRAKDLYDIMSFYIIENLGSLQTENLPTISDDNAHKSSSQKIKETFILIRKLTEAFPEQAFDSVYFYLILKNFIFPDRIKCEIHKLEMLTDVAPEVFTTHFWWDCRLNIISNMTRKYATPHKIFGLDLNMSNLRELVIRFLRDNSENEDTSDKNKSESILSCAYMLVNWSRFPEGRSWFIDVTPDGWLIDSLSLYKNEKFRAARSLIYRNLCFGREMHDNEVYAAKLRDEVVIPLIDSSIIYTETSNPSMPGSFLYVDNEREPVVEIRKALLEGIYMHLGLRKSRVAFREADVYTVIKDLHLWEPDEKLKDLEEDIAQLLIRTEEEIGVDDLLLAPSSHESAGVSSVTF